MSRRLVVETSREIREASRKSSRRTTKEIAAELEAKSRDGVRRYEGSVPLAPNEVERFVKEYKALGNIHAAAKSSHITIEDASDIIRSHPELRADVRALLHSCGVTEERIIEEQARIAFSDPRKFYDEDGNMLPVHEWPEDIARATSGMDVTTTRSRDGSIVDITVKPRLWDKGASLRELGRMARIAGPEQHEHSGKGGGPIAVKAESKLDIISSLMSLVQPKEDPK